mmetsp:Transcript_31042/g.60931  ORF Transcript_31042/g.60931 Transcript_31042/m.60931 type:complete len:281 (+) Transcript_31042:141-983(+)
MTQQAIPQPDPGENQLTFSAVIEKTPGMSLGLDVAFSPAIVWMRHGIFVKTVFSGGSVAAWNEGSEVPLRVQPGDLIVQVNTVQGDTLSMIHEMKVKQRLTLHILRKTGREEAQQSGHLQAVQPPPPPWQQLAGANVLMETTVVPQSGQQLRASAAAEPSREAETELGEVGPPPLQPNSIIERGPTAYVEPSEDQLSEAESSDGESARGRPATVEELLPQLRSLGSATLGGIIVAALDQRPWLYEAVLGERSPCSSDVSAGAGSGNRDAMPACTTRYEGL